MNSTPQTSLGVDAARALILDAMAPLAGLECVPLRAALGRILGAAVIAPCAVPAHDNSAMDGYALAAASLVPESETTLKVVGTALAGRPWTGVLGAGEALRIMTGAVLPAGADLVVMQEVVQRTGATVTIPPGLQCGQNVRHAGEDLAPGAVAVAAGTRMGPAELGLVASLGLADVSVRRRVRVAFFSTGDELASLGEALAPGEVYDSNRLSLFGALSRLGCELIDLGVIPDEPAAIEAAFTSAAASADAIISSGGVSVGEADFVRELMGRLGEVGFWKIDMKPGRPMAFGRIGTAWMFGLPGNPVAVMVSFYQFVQEALLKLGGMDPLPLRPLIPFPSASAIRHPPGRREFLRARLFCSDGIWQVQAAGAQGSGILRSMVEANCFIVLDETRGAVAAGECVPVQLFDGLI